MKTEYRVRSTEGWEDRAKVQIGAELLCKGEKVNTKNGRDVASPRPPWLGGQGEALPLPAGGARERQLGWHAVPTLPRGKGRRGAEAQAATTARSAVPARGIHSIQHSVLCTLYSARLRRAPTKLKRETFAAGAAGLGVGIGEFKAAADHLVGVIENRPTQVEGGLGVDEDLNRLRTDEDVAGLEGPNEAEFIRQPIAAAAGDSDAEVAAFGLTGCQGLDLGPSGWRQLD